MLSKRAVAALFLSQLLVGVAFAQSVIPPADNSAGDPSEFGRVSGGELNLLTKPGDRLAGSFGMSMSRSQFPFVTTTNGPARRYDATLGGTVVPDRVWFFASAQQSSGLLGSQLATALPQSAMSVGSGSRAIDAKLNAQLGDRQSLAASFAAARNAATTTGITAFAPAPASFLSLHYTGVVSSNMFFTASVSRSRAAQPELFAPVRPQ